MKWVRCVCALLVCGCGGDGGASDVSGVDGTLVISELSAEQLERVCRAQIEWGFRRGSVEESCTLEAVFETEDLPSCRVWVDACVDEAKEGAAAKKQKRLEACAQSELHCDYTVEEYERCYKEESNAWEEVASSYSCREAGDYSDAEYPDEVLDSDDPCRKVRGVCYIY